ncbi:MAG TPA: alpha-amylase family glycosyl hydrolase [Candidatus Eisenbacteria bacterium]
MRPDRRVSAPLLALLLVASAARGGPREDPASARGAPPGPERLAWCRGAVFYEIFVRSFADSDGDGVGDFRGLSGKLDYLNDGDSATVEDLGIDAIWLMPVFPSPSYHGYDVTDYEHVNPAYGTEADFDSLLARAHRRGIRVILDLVLNHTSSWHPWFRDAASSPRARHRSWYVWRDDDPGWTQPWGNGPTWHRSGDAYYYGIFWSGMPDLNFRNPEVRAEMERIATLWLKRGVDGFRLDATRHLVETGPGAGESDAPETHAFLREFAASVRRVNPGAVLVGENWTDATTIARYYGSTDSVPGGDELPMNFNFPLASAIVDGVRDGGPARLRGAVRESQAAYPPGILDAPFLTNHDMVRLATQLDGDPGKLRVAAAILLTLPGAPFLYYGEEVGLSNGPTPGDESKRTPMPWGPGQGGGFTSGKPWFPFAPGLDTANVASESREPRSLLRHYRDLIRVRRASAALRTGTLRLLPGAENDPCVAYFREVRGDSVLVVHNLADHGVRGWSRSGVEAAALLPLLVDGGAVAISVRPGPPAFNLPAHATGIWRVRSTGQPPR